MTKPGKIILSTRQQTVIELRESGLTLQQIGNYLHVSRERIRQILVEACGSSLQPVYPKAKPRSPKPRKNLLCVVCGDALGNVHSNRRLCEPCREQRHRRYIREYQQSHRIEIREYNKVYRLSVEYAVVLARYWQKQVEKRLLAKT